MMWVPQRSEVSEALMAFELVQLDVAAGTECFLAVFLWLNLKVLTFAYGVGSRPAWVICPAAECRCVMRNIIDGSESSSAVSMSILMFSSTFDTDSS